MSSNPTKVTCAVLHTDGRGNTVPCPGCPHSDEPEQETDFGEEDGRPEPPDEEALNSSLPVRPDPRQPAYDAVYEYIRGLGLYLPPGVARRNAIIWRAVHAALNATPTGRCVSSHCVEGGHILPIEGEGEALASDAQDTGRRCPRCDCPDGASQCEHCKVCPHASASAVAGSDDFIREECPHCDEPQPSQQMDTHVATAHANLPPCIARIETELRETYRCAFRAGHDKGEYGRWHASTRTASPGRYVWNDDAMAATPHRPSEPSGNLDGLKVMGDLFHSVVATGDGQPDSHPALTAKLHAPAADDDRLRQAEIRAAVAEHEAEASRNQVQALVRELLRMRDVPEEDLPQKVRVILLDEEAP